MSKKGAVSINERAIAERVRAARKQAGLSQGEVAAQLGLTDAGYGHYERGRQSFSVEMLTRLAHVLGRPLEHFLGLEMGLTREEEQLVAAFRELETEQQRTLALDMVRLAARNRPAG